jgi:hypothetical protein
MQDSRIAFARARKQVRTAFKQNALEAGQSQIAENCATYDSATDDGSLEGWICGWRAALRCWGDVFHDYWYRQQKITRLVIE